MRLSVVTVPGIGRLPPLDVNCLFCRRRRAGGGSGCGCPVSIFLNGPSDDQCVLFLRDFGPGQDGEDIARDLLSCPAFAEVEACEERRHEQVFFFRRHRRGVIQCGVAGERC
jgi:hypothetical protein